MGPHSKASNRSESPSLSISLNTEPETNPSLDRTCEFLLSDIYYPLLFVYNIDVAGIGYWAGITLPPTKISKSPSLSISA